MRQAVTAFNPTLPKATLGNVRTKDFVEQQISQGSREGPQPWAVGCKRFAVERLGQHWFVLVREISCNFSWIVGLGFAARRFTKSH
jgi:hypothetical protein